MLRGHEAGLVVVDQMQIFVRQAERGGRLGGDDVIALPHGVGQQGDVVLAMRAGVVEAPHGDRGHAA